LPKAAQVRLSLFTLLCEQVFQTTFQGNAGSNVVEWKLQNQIGQSIASGLYLYALETDDGTGMTRKTGKVAVLH